MAEVSSHARFEAKIVRPAKPGGDTSWAFVVLPKDASAILPRRGRTTIDGAINGHAFQATLEPDGQLSHWLKVNDDLRRSAGVEVGDVVTLEIMPVDQEPNPEVPEDLQNALDATPEAQAAWLDTTAIARLDWVHWIESAKQARTRAKRIDNACDMLGSGKRRVCCFDQSGYYSKSFSAPAAAE